MRDYWRQCGYRLLEKTGEGHLVVTDDFLRSLLERPELAPVAESCAAELALHQRLRRTAARRGRRAAACGRADEDARANYAIWLRFRAAAARASDAGSQLRGLFRGEGVDVPPLFVHQLTQILLRHILGDEATPHAGARRRDAVSHRSGSRSRKTAR